MSKASERISSVGDSSYKILNDPLKPKRKYTRKTYVKSDGTNYFEPSVVQPTEEQPKKGRRQVMKVHGVSRDPKGNLLFAVSFAKAKSFHYITNEVMKESYPNYLIGFYERHVRIDNSSSINFTQK